MLIRHGEAREFDFHGLRVADYGATCEGTASVATVEVPAGGRHRFAYSSRCEKLYFVTGGTVQFDVDGVVYKAGPGDLVVVPRGDVFRYANWWDESAKMLLVHVPAFDPAAEHVLPNEIRLHDVHVRGKRIALRPMTENDWEHVLAWNADPEVLVWSDDTTEIRPEEDTKDIYRSVSRFAFVFIIEDEGEPIGECWLQKMNLPEIIEQFPGKDLRRIDIMIGRKDVWGQGLGSDAIKALVAFGFEQDGADGIFTLVSPKNLRSQRAFRKAGFRQAPLEWRGEVALAVWREMSG
jgi:RimJ/RimL family protein N-acetyltransferase/mannose-6-phosphate isomerase-like protein (cupin superfamily)